MRSHLFRRKSLVRLAIALGGAICVAILGIACLFYPFAEPLKRWSYDLPFTWRAPIETPEVALVYMDDQSAQALGQPFGGNWDRRLHAQLLRRLTQDQARMVFFDVVFDTDSKDPKIDSDFAEAIQQQGHVVLGAALDVDDQTGVRQERIQPPIRLLRKVAAGWGLLVFRPLDPDYGVRQLYAGTFDVPTAAWRAAELLGDAPGNRSEMRWLNYYGPRGTFPSVSFVRALDTSGVPADFFKNRIVMVGGRSSVGFRGARRDEFASPYSHANHEFFPGLEVQATTLLNLLHREWLTRAKPSTELALVLAVAVLAGGMFAFLRPPFAITLAVLTVAGVIWVAFTLQWNDRIWFNWLVPAAVEVPAGLFWSVGSQYVLESSRRKQLRRAFSYYLSPAMADQIANSDFDLSPGGKLVDVTVVFTDLENFTTISEKLEPSELSKILTDYFSQTTDCILKNKGTIIKYIGDAVFAAWGAPIPEPAHAIRAAETACRLRSLTELEIRGIKLRTRVGVHSGQVLAGNLGSAYRFDYTMIGDAVNLASRLESLNKYLHTQVLVSDAVRQQLGDKFVTRRLGEFRLAGKTRSVVIHELYCPRDGDGNYDWIDIFETGVKAFAAGNWQAAREAMEKVRRLRNNGDGPAEFYLDRISKTGKKEDEMSGIIQLTEK